MPSIEIHPLVVCPSSSSAIRRGSSIRFFVLSFHPLPVFFSLTFPTFYRPSLFCLAGRNKSRCADYVLGGARIPMNNNIPLRDTPEKILSAASALKSSQVRRKSIFPLIIDGSGQPRRLHRKTPVNSNPANFRTKRGYEIKLTDAIYR